MEQPVSRASSVFSAQCPLDNDVGHNERGEPTENNVEPVGTAATLSRRLFGLKKNYEWQANPTGFYTNDYEARYPEDSYGEEAGPNARVWQVYLDETRAHDAAKIGDWKDNTDVILVFAGLFSAVVTAFLVEVQKKLGPDAQEKSAALLFELVAIQRAMLNGTTQLSPVPSSSTNFSQSSSDVWVSGLWFASLCLSLSTAFLAMLTKQWLQQYMVGTSSSSTPQEHSRKRQFRAQNLKTWMVGVIIDFLPIIMYAALALFFIGLGLFLHVLHRAIFFVVVGIAGTTIFFYIFTTFLSILFPSCPYRSPLSHHLHQLSYVRLFPELLWTFIQNVVRSAKAPKPNLHIPSLHLSPSTVLYGILNHTFRFVVRLQPPVSLLAAETDLIRKQHNQLDVAALFWLYAHASNSSILSIANQAVGSLPQHWVLDYNLGLPWMLDYPRQGTSQPSDEVAERRNERLLRAVMHLSVRIERPFGTDLLLTGATYEGHSQLQNLFKLFLVEKDHADAQQCVVSFLEGGENADVKLHARTWEFVFEAWQPILLAAQPFDCSTHFDLIHTLFSHLAQPGGMFDLPMWLLPSSDANSMVKPGTMVKALDMDQFVMLQASRCLLLLLNIPIPDKKTDPITTKVSVVRSVLAMKPAPEKTVHAAVVALCSLQERIGEISPYYASQSRLISEVFDLASEVLRRTDVRWSWKQGHYLNGLFLNMWGSSGSIWDPLARFREELQPQAINIFLDCYQDALVNLHHNPTHDTLTICQSIQNVFITWLVPLPQENNEDYSAYTRAVDVLSIAVPALWYKGLLDSTQYNILKQFMKHMMKYRASPWIDEVHEQHDTVVNVCKGLMRNWCFLELQQFVRLRPDAAVWTDRIDELKIWTRETVAEENMVTFYCTILEGRHELLPSLGPGIWQRVRRRFHSSKHSATV